MSHVDRFYCLGRPNGPPRCAVCVLNRAGHPLHPTHMRQLPRPSHCAFLAPRAVAPINLTSVLTVVLLLGMSNFFLPIYVSPFPQTPEPTPANRLLPSATPLLAAVSASSAAVRLLASTAPRSRPPSAVLAQSQGRGAEAGLYRADGRTGRSRLGASRE